MTIKVGAKRARVIHIRYYAKGHQFLAVVEEKLKRGWKKATPIEDFLLGSFGSKSEAQKVVDLWNYQFFKPEESNDE